MTHHQPREITWILLWRRRIVSTKGGMIFVCAGNCGPAARFLSHFFFCCTLTECLLCLPACKTLLNKKSDGVKVSCIPYGWGCIDFTRNFCHVYISICISFFLSFLSVSRPFFSLLTCISVFIADNVLSSHFRFTLLWCSDVVSLFLKFGFSNRPK